MTVNELAGYWPSPWPAEDGGWMGHGQLFQKFPWRDGSGRQSLVRRRHESGLQHAPGSGLQTVHRLTALRAEASGVRVTVSQPTWVPIAKMRTVANVRPLTIEPLPRRLLMRTRFIHQDRRPVLSAHGVGHCGKGQATPAGGACQGDPENRPLSVKLGARLIVVKVPQALHGG